MTMRSAIIISLLLCWPLSVRAFEAGRTHAGLTEQAAFQSGLNKTLVHVWGLRRGVFEDLPLAAGAVAKAKRWSFVSRLFQADPGCGCVPTKNLVDRALGWLVLGSVLEVVPPDRVRHHFLDPATGKGLAQRRQYPGVARRVSWSDVVAGGGSLAGFVTGSNFDLTGRSALAWATSKDNELGLGELWSHMEKSGSAANPRLRAHHAAMALLCMGSLLHLLQDMAAPSHVHNDFVVSHLRRGDPRGGSGFEAWVAARYGRFGVSRIKGDRTTLNRFADFFLSARKQGLARWTAGRFLSVGMFPSGLHWRRFAKWLARNGGRLPPHQAFDIKTAFVRPLYLWSADGSYRLIAYEVGPKGLLRFWMDRRVYADYAAKILPKALGYSVGLLHYFFRGRLALSARQGGKVVVKNAGVPLAAGRLSVLVEARDGTRRPVATKVVSGADNDGVLARVSVPRSGRVVALFVGKDKLGERIVALSNQ